MPGIKFRKVKPSQFEQLEELVGSKIVKADTYIGDDGTVYFLTENEFEFISEQKNETENAIIPEVDNEEKICYNNNIEENGALAHSKLIVWNC